MQVAAAEDAIMFTKLELGDMSQADKLEHPKVVHLQEILASDLARLSKLDAEPLITDDIELPTAASQVCTLPFTLYFKDPCSGQIISIRFDRGRSSSSAPVLHLSGWNIKEPVLHSDAGLCMLECLSVSRCDSRQRYKLGNLQKCRCWRVSRRWHG